MSLRSFLGPAANDCHQPMIDSVYHKKCQKYLNRAYFQME